MLDRLRSITKKWLSTIESAPRKPSSNLSISPDHVVGISPTVAQGPGAVSDGCFVENQHYFQIRINEMFLADARKWSSKIDPMVFVVSEFIYDEKVTAVPCVVGPDLIKKHGVRAPAGMIMNDTRVAGVHPYRGGALTISVVLFQVTVEDYARRFLNLIDSAAGALDFSTALAAYMKIAGVITDGVESLLGEGGNEPLMGWRFELSGNELRPRYFAVIDQCDIDPASLWVRDSRLLRGRTASEAQPFRESDYVLFSVDCPDNNRRNDMAILPFYPMWKRVQEHAARPDAGSYRLAKANMSSLFLALTQSPDLTEPQANELTCAYDDLLVSRHKTAVKLAKKSVAPPDPLADVRNRALAILDRAS